MLNFERAVSDSELGENRRSPTWHGRRRGEILDFGFRIFDFGLEEELCAEQGLLLIFIQNQKPTLPRRSAVLKRKQCDAIFPRIDGKEGTALQVVLGLKNGGTD